MARWRGLAEVPADLGATVVTIGVFDGVHRGHQVLIERVVRRAEGARASPMVVTFDPHPLVVLRPEAAPAELTSVERRAELLAGLGIEGVLVLAFTAELSHQEPEDFVRTVLVEALHARAVVVGESFRFGHRAAGDEAMLRQLGRRYGFGVEAVPLAAGEGVLSSTRVRDCLARGDVTAAAAVLGRLHRLSGTVVHGAHRGRQIGYPTANLGLPARAAVPADGVYAGWLTDAAEPMPAAVSIGTNPTFDGRIRRVEAYVLDRDDIDLYGRPVSIDFLQRLRPTERFGSVDELRSQMAQDVERTRAVTAAQAGGARVG